MNAGAAGTVQSGSAAPADFSWTMARLMARYSARAYLDHTVCDVFSDAQALLSELVDENYLIIAFRGSKEPKDFIQDAKFRMRELLWRFSDYGFAAPCKVHAGFLEDFQAIEADIVPMVRIYLFKNPTGRIFITGHSLGGALAILCGLAFKLRNIPVDGIYTFGQPRVGNGMFAGSFNDRLGDRTFRIVNQNDIVPRSPGVLMGYRHCGQEVFLPTAGGWVLNPSTWAKAASDALGFWGAFRKGTDVLISEHFIDAYIDRIRSLL